MSVELGRVVDPPEVLLMVWRDQRMHKCVRKHMRYNDQINRNFLSLPHPVFLHWVFEHAQCDQSGTSQVILCYELKINRTEMDC